LTLVVLMALHGLHTNMGAVHNTRLLNTP